MPRSAITIFSSLVLALVLALTISTAANAQEDPFGPLRVGVNRGNYSGRCPVTITYTGNVNIVSYPRGGFIFNYYWTRSDGAKGPVTIVRPNRGQRMVIVNDSWTLGGAGRHYEVSETLHVNSGNIHLEEASRSISITCR